jgi:hypothetical protein
MSVYILGCKRILLDQDLEFYNCFEKKKAKLITDRIVKINENRYLRKIRLDKDWERKALFIHYLVLLLLLVRQLKLMLSFMPLALMYVFGVI